MKLSGPESEQVATRKTKLEQIARMGVPLYPYRYEAAHTVSRLVERYASLDAATLEQDPPQVRTAGRILAIRGFGKASFCALSDGENRIQVYVKKNEVDEATFELFGNLDIGDVVGVAGPLFRTRTNELTILVKELAFLAKCFIPLPEKWHGLTDVEIRYRRRYLDLMVNPEVRGVFRKRAKIVKTLRRFLDDRDYLEVETPMMHPIAGGATARPFITHHNTLDMDLYLRVAPELYLKRLVAGGMERVYEINRNFRNEGISTQHNPEFTMLEFYQAYANYQDLIALTQEMIRDVVDAVAGLRQLRFKEHVLDFDAFTVLTLREAIVKFWDRGGEAPAPADLDDAEGVRRTLERAGIEAGEAMPYGKLLGLLFEAVVEDKLIQPTFITEYPIELSPLSKKSANDPRFVDRFEFFIAGMEIANAYSELNDPADQEERFLQQVRERERGDEEAQMMDEDYIRALSYGMPPTAGEGIGIDRLAMVLTDSPSIRDVILFPLMKPKAAGERGEGEETEATEGGETVAPVVPQG
ncbi:MAG: lysine--tRNA ligase [Acidobacteria bacterium]|nr:lysine--tRNA ligase [Acidobacteriota bacterium]